MQRIATSLSTAGFEVTLIGRKTPQSVPLVERNFRQKRLNVWFQRGKLFYIEYNLRLFWHLLCHNYDIYGATDLDTLLPHFIVSRLKRRPMTYDAHEYFAELPEIVHRPNVRRAWKMLEKTIVPRLKYAYTINDTYRQLFKQHYNIDFEVVRNATVLQPLPTTAAPHTEPYILYQGAVNVGRGVEQVIEAMQYVENIKLYICGKGDVHQNCVDLVRQLNLQHKVTFFGQIPPEQLRQFTLQATLGFTLFTNDGLSYYYSLANRFFDYFHSGVPQLAINFPEYKRINDQFEVALLLDDLNPIHIAQAINQLLTDQQLYQRLRQNCLRAREQINWQTEEKKLLQLYNKIKNATS
jgi:glycosyltransferase involved in cell wall biosynthesis